MLTYEVTMLILTSVVTFEGHKEKERVVGKLNGGGSLVEVRGDGTVNVSAK
jgi:hypothetical protein